MYTRTGTVERGFTLIELSIVLVIIGLIVGGVLVGQNLIHAAGVRGTITQIQKFQTAATTFQGKYGFLPGDIKDPDASNFGFAARGPYAGEGDGDGFLTGIICTTGAANCSGPHGQMGGENPMFWVDLSAARLIDGGFSTATPSTVPSITVTPTSSPPLAAFFPEAKLGRGNYFYTWSGAFNYGGGNGAAFNFFGLSSVSSSAFVSTPGLTVNEAYAMDKKIDDGFPQEGNVRAWYLTTGGIMLAAGGGAFGVSGTPAASGSATTCFDNGGNAGTQQSYSVEISNGSNVNCALSFRFQ